MPATRKKSAPKAKISETSIHMSVAAFIRSAWPADLPWWHTPNGGRRAFKTRIKRDGSVVRYSPEAEKLKAMGVRAGVPDLLFMLPNGQVGFIELKTTEGALSVEQAVLRRELIALKCGYVVCTSVDEVEATLARWLALYGRELRGRTVVRNPPHPLELEASAL